MQLIKREPELELLPPLKKHECEECHKEYRHVEKCKDNKFRCRKCKRHMVTNIFYTPIKRPENKFIGKFNMTDQEQRLLKQQFIQAGCTPESAQRKVNYHMTMLRNMKSQNRFKKKCEENNLLAQKKACDDLNKKLLEGLGLCKNTNRNEKEVQVKNAN